MEDVGDMKAALKAAEARAAESEANMLKAAQAGKELLDELHSCEKIRDELKQEAHSLRLALQSKEATEVALNDELADLNKRLKANVGCLKDLDDVKKELESTKGKFSAKEAEWTAENEALKAENDEMREKLLHTGDVSADHVSSIVDSEAVNELNEQIEMLKSTVDKLKVESERLRAENEEETFASRSLQVEIDNMKLLLAGKDDELASYRDSMRQAKEELHMMQLEDDDEDVRAEVAPKGNSLFSEVDDRRHIAEDQLKKYKQRCEALKAQHKEKLHEMQKLRMQNVRLMNLTASGNGNKYDQAYVQRLQEMLQSECDKNKMLTEHLSAVEKASHEASAPKGYATSTPEANAELLRQLQQQIRQNLQDGEKIKELSSATATLERQAAKLKSENFSLKMRLTDKIQSAKSSSSSAKAAEEEEEEVVVENVFFEPKKPVEALRETSNILPPPPKPNKKPKKSVTISDEFVEKEPKSTGQSFLPEKVVRQANEIVKADEECEKMNEQCKQQ